MATESNEKICGSCKYFHPFDGHELEGACKAGHHVTRDYFKCSNRHYEYKGDEVRTVPASTPAKRSMVGGLGGRLATAVMTLGLQTKK